MTTAFVRELEDYKAARLAPIVGAGHTALAGGAAGGPADATRLLQIAHELESDHAYTTMLRALEHALGQHATLKEQRLPVNIDGAIAAVCGDLGLPPEVADALLIISRVPGLTAHVLEEQSRESPMRAIDPTSHSYDGPPERRLPEWPKAASWRG